tara:strand:+ start:551 stop:775 length:225 start_codon:yes stop_codon:yes gene_type:complete
MSKEKVWDILKGIMEYECTCEYFPNKMETDMKVVFKIKADSEEQAIEKATRIFEDEFTNQQPVEDTGCISVRQI